MRMTALSFALFFALSVCSFPSAWALKPADQRYFNSLNYFNAEKKNDLYLQEQDFIASMKAILQQDELKASDVKKLIYGSLYLTNTNQGVRFEAISLEELKAIYTFSHSDADLKTEMLAREDFILSALKRAQNAAPKDYRIGTWILTHQMYVEELQHGGVSEKTFNKIYAIAEKNIFSYSALAIIANELSLSRKQQDMMLTLAQKVSDDQIPCIKNSQGECFDKKVAPNTSEVGKLLTGDIFLRYANQFVQDNHADDEGQRIKPGVSARVVYGLIRQDRMQGLNKTRWDKFYNIKKRVKVVNLLLWKQVPVSDVFFNSVETKKVYSCFSCHSSGDAR